MKKFLFLPALLLSGSILFTSCEKDDPDPTPTHIGFWKGKYGGTGSYPTIQWGMLLRADGTVRVYDGADSATAGKAEGTYSLTGSTLNTSYSYISGGNAYSTTAILNANKTFMEGTYGVGAATTGGGVFFMAKE